MTRTTTRFDLTPALIDGAAGRLFVVHYRPEAAFDRGTDLIIVPPFAEEMNRSRRMTALLARALTAEGWGVLSLDLFGTGDSDGAFEDATWETWCTDVIAAAAWLKSHGDRALTLAGLRFGGLLAASVAARIPGVERLTLWCPVLSGTTMLTQFLRIRIAAALGECVEKQEAEDTASLRRRLAEGETLDVAGYGVSGPMAEALDRAHLADVAPPADVAVDWFELVRDSGRPPPAASRKAIEAWSDAGIRVKSHAAVGEPFWSLQELTIAPALIERTRTVLCP